MGVQLREKKMSNGQISFYLDIYFNKNRWYEFLDIHINKNKPSNEDKEKKRLANEIRSKRESELIVQDNGLIDKSKRKANFVEWFEKYIKERGLEGGMYSASLTNLKRYLNGRSLSFNELTAEWIKGYTRHLLKKVKNNSARVYLMNLQTALDDAVRSEIIVQNPFRKLAKHEKVKRQATFNKAYSFEELQLLADTECDINPQFKEAYFFSCFTGLRWSDVNPLKWSDIITKVIDKKEQWFIYFKQDKTEKIEYLPLSEQAVDILKRRKKQSSENNEISLYVFPKVKEIYPETSRIYFRVAYSLKRWAKAAGLDPKQMHFHTGRHTFATNVLESSPDGDLWTVSKLLGHKSINSTQIYAHVRDGKKKAAVQALPKLNMKPKAA